MKSIERRTGSKVCLDINQRVERCRTRVHNSPNEPWGCWLNGAAVSEPLFRVQILQSPGEAHAASPPAQTAPPSESRHQGPPPGIHKYQDEGLFRDCLPRDDSQSTWTSDLQSCYGSRYQTSSMSVDGRLACPFEQWHAGTLHQLN